MTLMLALGGHAILLIAGVLVNNGLINARNQADNAFAGIDAMLKKRFDLIPNLVSSVQTYMQHERGVLDELTQLRAKALGGGHGPDGAVELDKQATRLIGNVMVAAENYPDLKANTQFLQLQGTLTEVEEQIAAARRAFNAAVTDYNNAIEMFPGSLLAGSQGLKRRALFEISATERAEVNVAAMFRAS